MGPHASGVNSILPKEHGSQFFYLPIIKHSDDEVIYPQGSLGVFTGAHKPSQPDKLLIGTLRALNKMPPVTIQDR